MGDQQGQSETGGIKWETSEDTMGNAPPVVQAEVDKSAPDYVAPEDESGKLLEMDGVSLALTVPQWPSEEAWDAMGEVDKCSYVCENHLVFDAESIKSEYLMAMPVPLAPWEGNFTSPEFLAKQEELKAARDSAAETLAAAINPVDPISEKIVPAVAEPMPLPQGPQELPCIPMPEVSRKGYSKIKIWFNFNDEPKTLFANKFELTPSGGIKIFINSSLGGKEEPYYIPASSFDCVHLGQPLY